MSKIYKGILKSIESSINEVVSNITEQSQKEVPKDTLELMKSYKVEHNGKQIKSGKIALKKGLNDIVLSYNTHYALIQHELNAKKRTTPGTKSKYLSDPFEKHASSLDKLIYESIKKELK